MKSQVGYFQINDPRGEELDIAQSWSGVMQERSSRYESKRGTFAKVRQALRDMVL